MFLWYLHTEIPINIYCQPSNIRRYQRILLNLSVSSRIHSCYPPNMHCRCVENALFHVYVCVGDYNYPLDHSVLVRSDIWHSGLPWRYVGLRADQATSRVPVGLSDWPPKCGAVRLAWCLGPRGKIGEWGDSNSLNEYCFVCDTIYKVNRRRIIILFILD